MEWNAFSWVVVISGMLAIAGLIKPELRLTSVGLFLVCIALLFLRGK